MTYYLLEVTVNGCIREFFVLFWVFFTVNLFSLTNAEAVLLHQNRPLLNSMVREQSTDPVFDQVSVRLSDAAHRNMNH